jgi:von Willebrand factor type D domain
MERHAHHPLAFSILALMLATSGPSWAAQVTTDQDANKPTSVEVETWRQKIIDTPLPKAGCFTASYPESAWREVPCTYEPVRVRLPRTGGGLRPAIVGNGLDFVAQPAGHIREAEGSFDGATGVTSESQTDPSTTPPTVTPNRYGLQLNTDFFTTSVCGTSPDPTNCRGWEQFILSSTGGAGIQYWISDWGPAGSTCPAPHHMGTCAPGASYADGWCEFQFNPASAVQCVVNGPGVHAIPGASYSTPLDITNVHQVKVRGRGAGVAGGTTDAAIFTYGTTVTTATGGNFFPDLATQWQQAEFNIFGACCGLQADLNPGATFVVRVAVTDGSMNAPSCAVNGFTGETNNMTTVNTTGPVMHSGTPSLVFTETNNGATTMPMCSQAVTVGDTHIATFDGVYYDFQASGDFVLAEDGTGFVVQARQASGAPTWPNASVNKAVAARMGATRVAIYIEPTRVEIDGVASSVADGANIRRPGGVQLARRGNVYWISDDRGNSVRATLNPSWIDVSVGLGIAPHTAVRGLLGNPNGNGRELVTRENVVLRQPVLFHDLYHSYAQSWRVNPKESLFTGETRIAFGIPSRPFYAKDLPREKAARALAACKNAGIQEPNLLDSCVLDTTVLADKTAVKVFTMIPAPRHVITPIVRPQKEAAR